jgi:predicted NAD-dependent protein-ADP-ribosyltransferase YbiA (DUF1768 family)
MTLSNLDSSVNYPDTMKVESIDKNSNKEIYQIEIFGVDVLITLGEPINKFLKKNIIYLPIYLIKYNNKVLQIGVYELDKRIISFNILDDDNLLTFISETSPLLYSFVDRDFILKLYLSPEKYEQEEEQKDKEKQIQTNQLSSKDGDIFTSANDIFTSANDIFTVKKKNINILPTETPEDANVYRRNFASARNTANYWMQQFMKNIFYQEIDNEGCGDCFFSTIRDAYKSIGLETTVANLRQLISERIAIEQFNTYKTLYEDNKKELENIKNNIKDKKNQYATLTRQLNDTISRTEKQQILEISKQIKSEITELTDVQHMLTESIDNYKFMKNIKSLEELKNVIKTSNYWADEWAIGQLEIILKIKFIIFSEDNYLRKDVLNVLQCQSGYVSEEIERSNNFDVKYYIMLNYGGSHYKLITYKDKSMFTFNELPYDVKVLIADKCLEKMSGIFSYIKEFVDFKIKYEIEKETQHGGNRKMNKYEDDDEDDDEDDSDGDGQVMDELYQFGKKKLWDDDVKLYFYNNSSDLIPGKASGEKIPKNKIKSFSKLSKIKNWRKQLDNFWVQPFMLDNKTWGSVEHYYQGSKFKNDNPKFYDKFSIDSKSSLSKNPSKAKELGENKNKRPEKVNIDKNYNKTIGNVNMYSAQEAKFSQHDDLANTLMATNKANLYYHRKGKYPIQNTNLMLIRKNMMN